jgi:uncharacterized protein YebE (UPF0316 family)
MKQVMSHVDNVLSYFAWAGGFACGTYVGMRIEERLALGMQVIRIITNQDSTAFIDAMREKHHGMTVVDANGAMGPVKMIFSIVQRQDVNDVISLILKHNPSAFYSVEDVRNAKHGVFNEQPRKMALLRVIFPNK